MKISRSLALICLLLSLVLQTAAVGFGKSASLSLTRFSAAVILTNPFYLLSLVCVGLQALTWQVALCRFPLSAAYLVMSLIYVTTLATSWIVFSESVTMANVIGSAFIVAGAAVLSTAYGKKRNA